MRFEPIHQRHPPQRGLPPPEGEKPCSVFQVTVQLPECSVACVSVAICVSFWTAATDMLKTQSRKHACCSTAAVKSAVVGLSAVTGGPLAVLGTFFSREVCVQASNRTRRKYKNVQMT